MAIVHFYVCIALHNRLEDDRTASTDRPRAYRSSRPAGLRQSASERRDRGGGEEPGREEWGAKSGGSGQHSATDRTEGHGAVGDEAVDAVDPAEKVVGDDALPQRDGHDVPSRTGEAQRGE